MQGRSVEVWNVRALAAEAPGAACAFKRQVRDRGEGGEEDGMRSQGSVIPFFTLFQTVNPDSQCKYKNCQETLRDLWKHIKC